MTEYRAKTPDAAVNRNLSRQCAAILEELEAARGGWVPLPQIQRLAAQYNARIHGLRKLGYAIENRTRVQNGTRHSWFRLVPTLAVSNSPSHCADRNLFPAQSGSSMDRGFLDYEHGRMDK